MTDGDTHEDLGAPGHVAVADPSEHEVAVLAARTAAAKGATDVVAIEVGPILGICESFVIASGHNHRLVRAISEEVEMQLKRTLGRSPRAVEGLDEQRWVLADYGDVIVHVFLDEEREFYRLERLYRDAARIEWADTTDDGEP